MVKRTDERARFLAGILVTAVEHAGYGFPGIVEYVWDVADPRDTYAVIYDRYEEEDAEDGAERVTWRIDIDTIAKGFGVARGLVKRPEGVAAWVEDLLIADRTNGEDGDPDVVGALLVLECAVFGAPMYA